MLRSSLVAAVLLVSALVSQASEIYFSFGGGTPGLGRAVVEDNLLTLVEPVDLGFPVTHPYKLAHAAGAGVVAVAVGGDEEPAVVLVPVDGGAVLSTALPAELSDIAATGDQFVVSASKGRFVVIDAASGSILSELNTRKALTPPGRKGEFIRILPGGSRALVSFQKDDDNSPAQGNRIVLLELDPLEVRADMPLVRDREELHISGNPKEQGPGPEVIMLCPKSNALAVTLDLYGALAFADLDAAFQGKLKNLTYVPTGSDGSWGNSFPDRATLVEVDGKEILIVSNASTNGGFALFDVASRKAIQHLPAAAGAEAPIDFPRLGKAATVISGKVKARSDEGLEKSSATENKLVLIDYSQLGKQAPATLESIDLGFAAHRITRVGDTSVAVFGEHEIVLVDVSKKSILDRKPLPGPVIRALGISP